MEKIKRIIVIDLLYLGDLLFAHPFFVALRRFFPEARIDLIANSTFSEIVKVNPNFDQIYSYDKSWSVIESYKFAKKIKKNNYQLALNIHGNWRTALLLKLISADQSIGYGSKGRGLFLDQIVDDNISGHMIDFYLKFANELKNNFEQINIEETSTNKFPVLKVEGKYLASAEEKLKKLAIKENFIVLNTGGSWPTKRWPKEYFAELADLLTEKNYDILFVGGPSDTERVNYIIDKIIKKDNIYNLCGETSLLELAAVLKKASLMISGDTGPAHLAAAVGTNTAAIFGPSDETKYAPRAKEKNILIKNKGLECRPCGEHECPLKHFKCMKEIKAEEITKKLQKEDLI